MWLTNTKSIVVVQERNNPSTDYFLLAFIQEQGLDFEIINHDAEPGEVLLSGKMVVFVRYIPKNWVNCIEKNRGQIAGIVLFFDDDLFDFKAFSGLPLRYQFKLIRLSYLRRSWLKKMKGDLWVSTPFLAEKYREWGPLLVLPKPIISEVMPVRLFYHGSASHSEEIEWLFPVIKQVLEQHSALSFEIMGDTKVNQLFKVLPRVTIIHPMSWTSYQSFISQIGRHIGLAPMLGKPFNAARSYTKFFDNCRAGAVGVYANHQAFTDIVKHEGNGLLVAMNQDDWVKAILFLASDEPLRQKMLTKALATCQQMTGCKGSQ